MRRALFLALFLAAAPCLAHAAWRAEEPDTTLGGFLKGLSDSTDLYFGDSAAPPDTEGLDSTLAYGLEHPGERGAPRTLALTYRPDLAFNRVDGPVWGGAVGIGRPQLLGQLTGRLGYAAGPNHWLGGGEYTKTLRRRGAGWSLRLGAGRATAQMNSERHERIGPFTSARALVTGKDHHHYYRTDGLTANLERQTETWRAGVTYRDQLESPLGVTTSWDLAHRPLSLPGNLPAAAGHAHELSLDAGWRLPYLPLTLEVEHRTSGRSIGSDFEYRRTRAAVSGNFGLGPNFSAVPQVSYGRLSGTPVPQASFYLGGAHSLRSVPTDSRGGTGMAVARLDLVETPDLLELAHIPHPAMFPLQAGLFSAAGSIWGTDPYGGPTVPGTDWPRRESWLSEVGASLIYQPGIPDPLWMVRFNLTRPLGPARDYTRWSISYTRALDLVRPFGD